nr:MAG TPA: zinc knuckle protein [Caudoviricetes sp.]
MLLVRKLQKNYLYIKVSYERILPLCRRCT